MKTTTMLKFAEGVNVIANGTNFRASYGDITIRRLSAVADISPRALYYAWGRLNDVFSGDNFLYFPNTSRRGEHIRVEAVRVDGIAVFRYRKFNESGECND